MNIPNTGAQIGAALQGLGQSLGNLSQTIYGVDAQNQAQNAKLAAADAIEKFKEGLWTDPDYGTPGQNDGYVQKFNNFMTGTGDQAGLKSTILQGITNPLARDQVSKYLDQAALEQGAEVKELQFRNWKTGTIADTAKRVSSILDKGGMTAQQQLDAAGQEYGFLLGLNLIDKAQYDSAMDQASQIAIRKDLTGMATAAYKEGGLAAAQRVISGDQTSYSSGGTLFYAGDQVKKLALADLELYDQTVQKNYDSDMEKLFANTVASLDGSPYYKADQPILNITAIQSWHDKDGAEADEEHKLAWLSRFTSLEAAHKAPTGNPDQEIGKQIVNQVDKIDGALRLVSGGQLAADATVSIAYYDKATGKWSSRDVKVTRQLRDAYVAENTHFIDSVDSGWGHVMENAQSLAKPMGNWDYWLDQNAAALKKMPNGGEIVAQAKYLATAPGSSEYTPDKIGKAMGELMKGVQIKSFQTSFNYNFGRLDTWDGFCQDIEDAKLAHIVVGDSSGNYRIGLSAYQDPVQRDVGAIAAKLKEVGAGDVGYRMGENARPWFQAKQPEKQPDLPKSTQKITSVSYTTGTYGDERQGVLMRYINYGATGQILQALVPDAGNKKSGWITVKNTNGSYYPDTAALKDIADRQAAYSASQAKIKEDEKDKSMYSAYKEMMRESGKKAIGFETWKRTLK